MEDKHVGFMILGFCLAMLFLIISYDISLAQIVSESCTHGSNCPMYGTLEIQRIISFVLLGILTLAGVYFILSRRIQNITKERARNKINLTGEEKQIIILLKSNDNSIYQSELIKKTKKSKVQITRILDKLEAKRVIDRKRRGMTNIIMLK
tara:strand:+ start:3903 stop:4355 length:453 start_codon:yes stop_codon:yes gene_type:complete